MAKKSIHMLFLGLFACVCWVQYVGAYGSVQRTVEDTSLYQYLNKIKQPDETNDVICKTIKLFESTYRNFSEHAKMYSVKVKKGFDDICDCFKTAREVSFSHLRNVRYEISDFCQYLQDYITRRAGTLSIKEQQCLYEIKELMETLYYHVLQNDCLYASFAEVLLDYVVYLPRDLAVRYKNTAISLAVVGTALLLHPYWKPYVKEKFESFLVWWNEKKAQNKKSTVTTDEFEYTHKELHALKMLQNDEKCPVLSGAKAIIAAITLGTFDSQGLMQQKLGDNEYLSMFMQFFDNNDQDLSKEEIEHTLMEIKNNKKIEKILGEDEKRYNVVVIDGVEDINNQWAISTRLSQSCSNFNKRGISQICIMRSRENQNNKYGEWSAVKIIADPEAKGSIDVWSVGDHNRENIDKIVKLYKENNVVSVGEIEQQNNRHMFEEAIRGYGPDVNKKIPDICRLFNQFSEDEQERIEQDVKNMINKNQKYLDKEEVEKYLEETHKQHTEMVEKFLEIYYP